MSTSAIVKGVGGGDMGFKARSLVSIFGLVYCYILFSGIISSFAFALYNSDLHQTVIPRSFPFLLHRAIHARIQTH